MATQFSVPSTFPQESVSRDGTEDYINQDNLSTYVHTSSTELGDPILPSSHSRKTHVQPSGRSIRNDYLRATGNNVELPWERRKINKRLFNSQAGQSMRQSYDQFGFQNAPHRPPSPASSHSSRMVSEIPDTDDASGIPRTVDVFPTISPYFQSTRNTDDDDDEPLFVTPSPTMRPQLGRTTTLNHNHHHQRPTPGPSNNPANDASNDPYDNPTHRARLRAMAANPGAHAYVRKRAPENDPDNREIKRLRTLEKLHWDEIADTLNRRRVAAGKTPTFTVAAVYGRFARVAPRIAELDGEDEFDYKDFLNFRHERRLDAERRRSEPPMPVLGEDDEAALVECYEEVERERWENVAKKFKVKAGLKLTPGQIARKWKNL